MALGDRDLIVVGVDTALSRVAKGVVNLEKCRRHIGGIPDQDRGAARATRPHSSEIERRYHPEKNRVRVGEAKDGDSKDVAAHLLVPSNLVRGGSSIGDREGGAVHKLAANKVEREYVRIAAGLVRADIIHANDSQASTP